MQRGIIAIGIDTDDELVAASLTDGKQIIFLASHEGQAIRFSEDDVRSMGRQAYGVRGMDLDKGDYIVGMAITAQPGSAQMGKEKKKKEEEGAVIVAEKGSLILSVTENGYGKRTPAEEYRLPIARRQGRHQCEDDGTQRKGCQHFAGRRGFGRDDISQYGKIIRTETKQIREAGRSTQGVRLLNLEAGDKVAATSLIAPEEPNGNGETPLLQ